VFFYRKGRKGFAEGAKASRPLQSPCALCGEKPQHDGEKSSYFVTIPSPLLSRNFNTTEIYFQLTIYIVLFTRIICGTKVGQITENTKSAFGVTRESRRKHP
jgi:hypothetical protein